MTVAYRIPKAKLANAFVKRLFGVFILAIYIVIYTYFYVFGVYPSWSYFGFRLDMTDPNPYWNGVLCIIAAYFFTPNVASKASDYILSLLFILAFVPIQLTVGLSNSIPSLTLTYQLSLLASFVMSVLVANAASRINWFPTTAFAAQGKPAGHVRKGKFKRNFVVVSGLLSVLLLVKFRSILNFAGIEEVYEQRAAASDYGINVIFGYIILWTTYVLAPMTLSIGLITRSRGLMMLSAAMLVTIYLITAAKTVFVVFAFVIANHTFNRFNLKENLYLLFFLPIAPILISLTVSFSTDSQLGELLSFVIEQIVVRGIAIQAMIFNLFIEYFSQHPFTYYSHVTGISWIIDYPYDLPIGKVVGNYQYGAANINANSGIWATDGVAAAGPFGVLMIGFLLGAFLGFTNRITRNVGHRFLSISLVPLVMLMVNVSMFTTLASGGGLLLVLLINRLWKDVAPETALR